MEKKITRKNMNWQQFFITVIGTAIGVALTFVARRGGAAYNPSLTDGISSGCALRHPCPPAAGFAKAIKKLRSSKLDAVFC